MHEEISMKVSRFTEAQIMGVLRQAEGGLSVAELCREHGISSATFYKWQSKYGGMDASMISQMKSLEDENRIQHIQPGKPQQNAYVERYNRTVRHEWLDQYIIDSIEEAQDYATQWLWTYNNDRPNMALGGITPAQKLKIAA
jgi:putative transposase